MNLENESTWSAYIFNIKTVDCRTIMAIIDDGDKKIK